ncbi:MAG: DUF5671 domain-containing protein [Patescibacteria group bacterium]
METTQNTSVKPRTSAGDFFLHLGVIVALYVSVISFINLTFNLIDYVFPNLPLGYGVSTRDLSFPVSALIIFTPAYIFLSWLLGKQYNANPYKRDLGVRKWLVYLTLFISGLVIAIDLVVLVYHFVSGELITTGFLLKVLSVFVVLVAVFWYYLSDLKDKIKDKQNKMYAVALALFVFLFIAMSFMIMGSPMKQRALKIDEQRVQGLQSVQYETINYWQQKGKLPLTVNDLQDSLSYFTVPLDPQTKEPYVYKKISDLSFELCAKFTLPSEENAKIYARYPEPVGLSNDQWKHDAGEQCFTRTIDPERHPQFEKTVPR